MSQNPQIGSPAYVPERPSQFHQLLEVSLETVADAVLSQIASFLAEPGPEAFLALEEEVLRRFMHASSHVVAGVLVFLHGDKDRVEAAVREGRERAPHATRSRGANRTSVRFLGGARFWIETPYVTENLRGRSGRRRGTGRRGATGRGAYPVLESVGIAGRATPALRSEVAKQTVRGASFDEAQEALADRGIRLDKKTVRRIALEVGEEALDQRRARIELAREGRVLDDELAGQRVVVSVDGGRLRLREGGERGRRGKKGRRRYRTPWREPKLLAVYVIDGKGKKVVERPMLYDATLGDADATFEILVAELLLRGAARAKTIILTGDGAPWIWNRADALARTLGLDPKQIVKVADFYHAVEHLTAIADLCASWTPEKRKRWVRRMRRHLKAGCVDRVIEAARELRKGRNAKAIGTEINYFVERKDRMRYAAFRRQGLPLGSGAVESAIRRVINLRLKGPSIFWRGPNAERMLHMRAYLKAGRWAELMSRVLHRSPAGQPMRAGMRQAA